MIVSHSEDGVVSIFDPKAFEIYWKDIPGFSRYVVSNLGVVKHRHIEKYPVIAQVATSTGTYIRINASGDNGENGNLHHLVCLAFHEMPVEEGARYEVNHVDGNKHNAHPTNLEWMTRRDNLIHAYQTGLRTDARKVLMHDHETGESIEYYAMAELARYLEVGKGSIWNIIISHRRKRYLGRYTFEFITPEKYNVRKADHVVQIAALDYVNKELHIADDLGEMELKTGVKRGTISWQLKSDNAKLVKGFWFRYVGLGDEEFPSFTDEEIEKSLVRSNIGEPIYVTDTLLNTTELYPSVNKFAKALHVSPKSIRKERAVDGMYKHYRIT